MDRSFVGAGRVTGCTTEVAKEYVQSLLGDSEATAPGVGKKSGRPYFFRAKHQDGGTVT